MTSRITKSDLDFLVSRLNFITASPASEFSIVDGISVENPGNFHLDDAYNGYKLERVCRSGARRDVLHTGYVSKRELYEAIQYFIKGIETAKEGLYNV